MGSIKVKNVIIKTSINLAVFLLLVFSAGNYLIWEKNYYDKVYPGVKINDLNLSGKTLAETENLITTRTKKIENEGLKFQSSRKSATLPPTLVSFDSDLSYQLFSFRTTDMALLVFGDKTNRSFFNYLLDRLKLKNRQEIKAIYNLDIEKIRAFLDENFKELNIEPENAYFSLTGADTTKLKMNQEKLGKTIDYDQVFKEIIANFDSLQNKTIIIKTLSKYPTIKQADLIGVEPEAEKILNHGEFTLQFSETTAATSSTILWKIKPDKIITWIGTEKIADKVNLSFDREKIKDYLKTSISPEIDQEAILPRFEIKDGRVTSWQTGKNGRQIDLEMMATLIIEKLLNRQNEAELITKEVASETLTTGENLRIEEIIGTGHSSFTGSPVNRRHNIKVGAAALHGLLIKPGEEFSLIKTLGDVSDKTGYLPELVIKGNKTVPEFGGGLCQIGTTVFRTALASGLPITMRQNHSYRVSYYEPAGTDATIYIPQPDLRFANDTRNHILIQARIVNNELYFDFWGVKDGRIATTTYPTIYNIVKPEPTKIIESEDLKPGEKKCTESSHNGADAYFDYKVIYPEGSTTTPVQERRFKSHYIPWQAVCLVGKTASSTITASSNPVLDQTQNQKATGTPVSP